MSKKELQDKLYKLLEKSWDEKIKNYEKQKEEDLKKVYDKATTINHLKYAINRIENHNKIIENHNKINDFFDELLEKMGKQ